MHTASSASFTYLCFAIRLGIDHHGLMPSSRQARWHPQSDLAAVHTRIF